MKDNCIFCKIINNEIPCNKIYEDDKVLVFLDLNQDCVGHSLIIPKDHFVTLEDLDNDLINHIMMVAVKMSKLFKERLGNDGLTLLQNNGLGQEVKHYHLHLLPKYENKVNLTVDEILDKLK